MSEYIISVPGDEENMIVEMYGVEDCQILGYQLTGEIVRCRDCVYYDTAGPWCFEPSKVFIDEYGLEICPTVTSDGFCKWGERRETCTS